MGKKTIFITDDEINTAVNNVVADARENIMLVSPWFELKTHLMDKILDVLAAKIKIIVLTRPETENEKHRAALAELRKRGAIIHIDPVLHTKFVIADDESMLMFSSNLIQTSLGRNHECGISTEEKDIIEAATNNVIQITERRSGSIESGQITRMTRDGGNTKSFDRRSAAVESGHCIYCNALIPFDSTSRKVRCLDCFKMDAGNARYCHGCGAPRTVSIDKPLCKDCWVRLK
nr:phospholipase D-like domain-containing protein [Candidatus Sigynarchaeota archaeon]